MKIKKVRDPEYPSTVVCKKSNDGETVYWTGSGWTQELGRALQYLREVAQKKAAKKSKHKAFIITFGFRH